MTHCEACDLEGPRIYGPFFTSYAFLEAHRAVHRLWREIVNLVAEPFYNKLFGGVK